MNLAAVTKESVLAAIAECDRLGRRPFLKAKGFGPGRTYFVDHHDRLYDSKAIMGVAHGLSVGEPLTSRNFTGGEQAVVRPLERLGFVVARVPNPDWTREEIILACELVASNGWRQLEAGDPRVKILSAILQSPVIHTAQRHPDFRSPSGVARKTWNVVNERSNGNRLDREVFKNFQAHPNEMRGEAARIRQRLVDGALPQTEPPLPAGSGFDRPYRGKPADGLYPPTQATSPEAREAAAREHDSLCQRLIEYLERHGVRAGELSGPPVDVAWRSPSGRQTIAEVKSCAAENDTSQLRLGLGQVLEYRQRLLSTRGAADAILVVSRVVDPVWFDICGSVGVRLVASDDEASWSQLVT